MKISDETKTILDKSLNNLCYQNSVPGMAVIISKNGKKIYEKYYGHRDVDNNLKITSDTIFPAASVTKSFSALAIMLLEERGKLSVDDLITDWLPGLELPDKNYDKKITIHNLLSNSSGLPGLGAVNRVRAESIKRDPDGEYMADRLSYIYDGYQIKTVEQLIEVISNDINFSLLGKPGTIFNYSNEGFALLQGIIERASGQSFVNFVAENVFEPLKMNHSTFLTKDLQDYDKVTELYGYKRNGEAFHSPAWWDVGDIYTNGSLKTTVSDLMKYLELYRLKGNIDGKQIISESSLNKMSKPHMKIPTGDRYGYGLKISKYKGIPIIGHSGNIKGGSSHILFVEKLGITIAVLANIAEFSSERLALSALDIIENLPVGHQKESSKHYYTHKELEEYTGLYQTAEGRRIRISIRENMLHIITRNNQFLAKPIQKDVFLSSNNEKKIFVRDQQDNVIGMFSEVRFIPKAKTKQEALNVTLDFS